MTKAELELRLDQLIDAYNESIDTLSARLDALEAAAPAAAQPDISFVISKDAHVTQWPSAVDPQAMQRDISAEYATYNDDDAAWNLRGYL